MFRTTTALAAVAAIVVACGGTTPPTSTPGSPPAAPDTGSPIVTTAPVTPAVTPAPATPAPASPQVSIQPDQSLENLFPDEVGGLTLEVTSARGEDILPLFGGDDDGELEDFLADLGTTIENVSAAISFSFGPGPTAGDFIGVTIAALQVRNVPAASVLSSFVALSQREAPESEIGSATIGGKNVTTLTDPSDPEGASYFYAVGDVIFIVAGTPALAEEALSKLP